MKKQLIGAAALLCSSVGMAASVTVIPSNAAPAPGASFTMTVHGDGFPTVAGATLGLSWNTAVANITSIVLAAGSPFTGGVVAAAPWNPISVLGPLVGTLPSGSFDAFVINFTALAAGNLNLQIIDDGVDLCWSDAATFACVDPATSYQVGNVTVAAPVVPVPAAAWLLMSALGSIAGLKRLRRS